MFVTIPTFTIFNKIKVVVRLCGQLAGHECAAVQPKLPMQNELDIVRDVSTRTDYIERWTKELGLLNLWQECSP
jgi:hypothetical protein